MAKLGSGRCGPPQGMHMPPVLLLIILAASIQASPVVADLLEAGEHLLVGAAEKLSVAAVRKINGWEDFSKGMKKGFKVDKLRRKIEARLADKQNHGPGGGTLAAAYAAVDTVTVVTPIGGGPSSRSPTTLPVLTADLTAMPALRTGSCAAGVPGERRPSSVILLGRRGTISLTGLRPVPVTLHECPVIAGGAPWAAVLGFGRGGDLSTIFPTFSFLVTSYGFTAVWVPTTTAPQPQAGRRPGTSTTPLSFNTMYPNDGLYYVQITGIRVGGLPLQLQAPTTATKVSGVRPYGGAGLLAAYLNNTERYTYLESGVYGRLKAELMRQLSLNPRATPFVFPGGQLCYVGVRVGWSFPRIAIVFAGGAAMELPVENTWYAETPSSPVCLAILPTTNPDQVSTIGSWLQRGRTMTIDLRAGAYTLTF